MEEILLQCIGIGCLFLHELPLMYHELSLIVCFTRITVNVPRIVINCLGDIASGCGWLQQPCHACASLRDGGHLWLRPIIVILLIMKTRHCISGCGGASIPASAEAEKKSFKAGTESARKVKTHISTSFDPYLNQKHYGVQEREVWGK